MFFFTVGLPFFVNAKDSSFSASRHGWGLERGLEEALESELERELERELESCLGRDMESGLERVWTESGERVRSLPGG
jgi:hypothetical protein